MLFIINPTTPAWLGVSETSPAPGTSSSLHNLALAWLLFRRLFLFALQERMAIRQKLPLLPRVAINTNVCCSSATGSNSWHEAEGDRQAEQSEEDDGEDEHVSEVEHNTLYLLSTQVLLLRCGIHVTVPAVVGCCVFCC